MVDSGPDEMITADNAPSGERERWNAELKIEAERLFRAVLQYSMACREFWTALSKLQQRAFFPPIFDAVHAISERFIGHEPHPFKLAQLRTGDKSFERGVELIRSIVNWLELQYPTGVECIICGVLPPGFTTDGEVKRPDLRFFLSPLHMAMQLMGSELGNTPKEPWWMEPCEPNMLNPIPAVMHQIDEELRRSAANEETIAEDEVTNAESSEASHQLSKVHIDSNIDIPFLGLVFNHDSTVSRRGLNYDSVPAIPLPPQPLKLLKFVHEAGQKGRTQNEILTSLEISSRSLATEKNRLKDSLIPIDVDLGPKGQYIVRCLHDPKFAS